MKEKTRKIWIPIIEGNVMTFAFLIIEIIFQKLGFFASDPQRYIVDSSLRFIFGTITLLILMMNYKKGRSKYTVKEFLTNGIPRYTYILIIPFVLYLIVDLSVVFFANIFTGKMAYMFAFNCLQQIGTGYYEESVRALIMCGLLKYYCDTKKNRVKTILLAGMFFGLSHGLNFFFGQDIPGTILQVFSCFIWGSFMAAIFIISENLTLLMIMHTVWDIIIRVPKAFFGFPEDIFAIDVLYVIGCIIQYGLMTATAVYICIKYNLLTIEDKK